MTLFVLEIRHDGLALGRPDSKSALFWLPASDWQGLPVWEGFRDATTPGVALNVTPVPGRHAPGGLQVVSLRGPGTKELSLAWKGEIHALKIESISKKLIRGQIGSVDAVMDRDEYTSFLNCFPHNDLVQDHGALALGDVICGGFRTEYGPEGRVQVSFKDAIDVIAKECEERLREQSGQAVDTPQQSASEMPERHAPRFHTPPEALSPFLFVENDDLCRQMWRDILTEAGVSVDAYGTYERALTAIRETGQQYKMAVLDVHLKPGATDHLGLVLAQLLVERQPDCRIVLSSAGDEDAHKTETWGAFSLHGYIVKPALLEEWVASIDAAASMTDGVPLRELLLDLEAQAQGIAVGTPGGQHVSWQTVQHALNGFCEEAPGTNIHVFRLHPRSWRGRCLASAGGRLNWEPYRGKLGKSVIRDAAEANDVVVDNEARDGWRHRWTKAMADYQSFCGLRLPILGHYRHVLVVFHSNPGYFTSEVQLRVRCCAEAVTRLLSSQQLERRGVHDAEQSAAGLGFACLAHEIYATLNGIDMAVNRAASLLSASDVALANGVPQLRRIVTSLKQHIPDLVANARILRGPQGGAGVTPVSFCIEKAIAAIREAMRELLQRPECISMQLELPYQSTRWLVKANAGALVTALFNVLLNAVQQIEMFTTVRARGWVRVVACHYVDAEGLPWALVFISDSGPGIHPEDWERVFEPGHTTKEDGTGLGLHICRQLLARVRDGTRQASIQIARSVLWAGTTMAVRLPLALAGHQED